MTNNNTQTIFAPGSSIAGYSQADLGDRWWQYVNRIPYAEHFGAFDDTTDPRGKRGSVEKALLYQPLLAGNSQNRVLLIGGAFGNFQQNVLGAFTVNRTIILPEGTTQVFSPLFNGNASNLTTDLKAIDVTNPLASGGRNNDQLKVAAAYLMNQPGVNGDGNGTSELFASIDGQKVQNPFQYRQKSQGKNGFNFYPIKGGLTELRSGYSEDISYLADPWLEGKVPGTPANPKGYPTIKDLGGYNSPEEEKLGIRTFADGYWLGANLGQGEHTLHFGATFSIAQKPAFALDITYDVLNPVKGTQQGDYLIGGTSNDYLNGDNGRDKLWGCEGDDLLLGGSDADILNGGKGTDELWGDSGSDAFIFKKGYGHDTIYDFAKGDKIDIGGLCIPKGTISKIDLPGGSSTQIDFKGNDLLTLVGVTPDCLKIGNGTITL